MRFAYIYVISEHITEHDVYFLQSRPPGCIVCYQHALSKNKGENALKLRTPYNVL